jgi:hypothetical protein
MILNFNQFLNESFRGFNSISDYLANIAEDNDYARSVISDFTKDIDPSVKVSNALNTLDKSTLVTILKMIEDEHKNIQDPVEIVSYTQKKW